MTGESPRNPVPELVERARPYVILANAGMTGESLRNPVPELVEGAHLLSSTVAYTSGSERFVLFCIIVIQGKIIPKLFKLLPKQ